MRILLGLTGSVASILYVKLIEELQKIGIVDVILTESSKHFVDMKLLCDVLVKHKGFLYQDDDEWVWIKNGHLNTKWNKNDPILHIELRNRSSALVIAPCSANTLAKISNGLSDNLLTSVARAWDSNRPFLIAPAMNTHMWEHPITQQQLDQFYKFSRNNKSISPVEKMLACNTEGMGALADIETIGKAVKKQLRWWFPLRYSTYFNTDCKGIPTGNHPGAFNAKRKNSTHTGVDLYVPESSTVLAVEDGTVVCVEKFTGPQDNSPWWLDTECVLVEGASGVICYGEIQPNVRVGQKVIRKFTSIGNVLRVIPPERPQHPELEGWMPSMLHMEVYPHGYYKPSEGYENSIHYLIDPTPFLLESEGNPDKVFTLDK